MPFRTNKTAAEFQAWLDGCGSVDEWERKFGPDRDRREARAVQRDYDEDDRGDFL